MPGALLSAHAEGRLTPGAWREHLQGQAGAGRRAQRCRARCRRTARRCRGPCRSRPWRRSWSRRRKRRATATRTDRRAARTGTPRMRRPARYSGCCGPCHRILDMRKRRIERAIVCTGDLLPGGLPLRSVPAARTWSHRTGWSGRRS